jgi:RNA polymerase sigma-70 factor (ECF subfamily)
MLPFLFGYNLLALCPYRRKHMELTIPGVATLRTDPDQAKGGDAETADVSLAASGDGSAFERLYRTHVARVYSLVRRMIGPDHADDIAQDVFVRAWSKLGTFRGDSAFGTWLHRLAVNVILARRTTIGTERGRYDDSADALDGVAGRTQRPELSLDFEDAIGRLPDGARQVFVLHDIEGYRHEEIANMLGIVPGTSKSQLHHARMALRKRLG